VEQGKYIVVGWDQEDQVSRRRKRTAYRLIFIVKIA
jgi:hypothetical protein